MSAPPTINTEARGNISRLSLADLNAMLDKLDDYDVTLTAEELIRIGEQLVEHDRGTMDKPQLAELVEWMKEGKRVSLRQIQNVFSSYATRAKEGKHGVGGKRKRTGRSKRRKTRKTRKSHLKID